VTFTNIQPKKTDSFGKTMEDYAEKWDRRAVGMNVESHGSGVAVGELHGDLTINRG